VTITISRDLVERARALDLTTRELFAEAIRLAVPGAFDLAGPHPRGGTDGSLSPHLVTVRTMSLSREPHLQEKSADPPRRAPSFQRFTAGPFSAGSG
jgi:hypothetical protein